MPPTTPQACLVLATDRLLGLPQQRLTRWRIGVPLDVGLQNAGEQGLLAGQNNCLFDPRVMVDHSTLR